MTPGRMNFRWKKVGGLKDRFPFNSSFLYLLHPALPHYHLKKPHFCSPQSTKEFS